MTNDPPSFVLYGKLYKLYKRGSDVNSPWWIRVQHKGKRQGVSTHTAKDDQALFIARGIVESVMASDWSAIENAVTRRGGRVATVGQILACMSTDSANRLLEFLGAMMPKSRRIESAPSDVFTKTLAELWLAKCQGLKRPDYDLQHENNGHANAVLRHVKAAFSKRSLAIYDAKGLNVRAPDGLLDVQELPESKFKYSSAPLSRKQIQAIRPILKGDALKVATTGCKPMDAAKLAAILKPYGITTEQLRWHCGATWLKMTGSLKLVAEKMNVSYANAYWHLSALGIKKVRLKVDDL